MDQNISYLFIELHKNNLKTFTSEIEKINFETSTSGDQLSNLVNKELQVIVKKDNKIKRVSDNKEQASLQYFFLFLNSLISNIIYNSNIFYLVLNNLLGLF